MDNLWFNTDCSGNKIQKMENSHSLNSDMPPLDSILIVTVVTVISFVLDGILFPAKVLAAMSIHELLEFVRPLIIPAFTAYYAHRKSINADVRKLIKWVKFWKKK